MSLRPEPPPHAPERGLLGRLLGSLHVTGVFWFRFAGFGIRILPSWGLPPVVAVFTVFFFCCLLRIRRAIAHNLEAALGRCGWWRRQRRIFRTMWSFAWCFAERYERLVTDRRVAVTVTGEEHWRQIQQDSRGAVLVTAHVGHWEIGSMLVPERHVHVVREEEMDPRAQAFVRDSFERLASSGDAGFTMHFASDDPAFGLRLLKALRRGELVAVQGDRPRSAGRSQAVELLGRPLELPAGPVALAQAAGVDLLPIFVFRRGRRQAELAFRPPIRVAGKEDVGDAVRRIAADVEWAIRREPHQWFCFRELWPR